MAAQAFDDLKAAARAVSAVAEADADEAEVLGHQTDRVVAAMRRARLNQMLVPKELGGLELPMVEAMQIVEIISQAEGSTGWCLMVQNVQVSAVCPFLPDRGAYAIFPNGADVTMAGHGVPRGRARPVEGGYLIKGMWGYASGIHHAEWAHTGCLLMDGDETVLDQHGLPVVLSCQHPKDTVELRGNWHVLGLRGTGSFDYTVRGGELFVPWTHCYRSDNPDVLRGGGQYRSGLIGATMWGHTGWALGIGRRTLDELAKIARKRVDAFGKMSDAAAFKQSFAEAEAKYRAARAFVYAAWGDLSESFAQDRNGTLEQVALIRLAMHHIHDVISQNATFAYRAARGISLRPSLLQRCYRDVHSGTQHLLLADQIAQDCGQVLLGEADAAAGWDIMGLINP